MNKNIIRKALVALLCASMLTATSCIGQFRLTNRLLGWNETVGNKFVNELVFIAFWILPVYEVSALADLLVLNSIEFWSGSNPMAQGEKVIDGNDGKYLVRCDGKGYDIESLTDGSTVRLDFDAETSSWSYTVDNETYTLFTFVDDNHIQLPVDNQNNLRTYELSSLGVAQYQNAVTHSFTAAR